MADLPPQMLQGKRLATQDFTDDEEIYRAFEPDAWEGDSIAIDAIELPDLSVNRSKYGPATYLLCLDRFKGFGVAGCQVGDVPKELVHLGVYRFEFKLFHAPTQNNYPHSVIQAFNKKGEHIKDRATFDKPEMRDLHLRWRNIMRQKLHLVIAPGSDF